MRGVTINEMLVEIPQAQLMIAGLEARVAALRPTPVEGQSKGPERKGSWRGLWVRRQSRKKRGKRPEGAGELALPWS